MTLWTPQYRTIDVPVYNDPSEVDQMEVEVNGPPDADDEDHPLYADYCDAYSDHIGDWQNDTPAYRLAHMPKFPSFEAWLDIRRADEEADAYDLASLRYDVAIDRQIRDDQSGYDPRDANDLPSYLLA